MTINNIRKALKEEKLKIGTEMTLKLLRNNKVKEVFVSSNCQETLVRRIRKYCELLGCKFSKLKENSRDLGAICKKPFSINICCSIK